MTSETAPIKTIKDSQVSYEYDDVFTRSRSINNIFQKCGVCGYNTFDMLLDVQESVYLSPVNQIMKFGPAVCLT